MNRGTMVLNEKIEFKGNRAVALLAVVPLVMSHFLFFFSFSSPGWSLWISAELVLPLTQCSTVSNICVTEPVRFRAGIDLSYASILLKLEDGSNVQSIAWSELNSKDLCQTSGDLQSNYAIPNNFCNRATDTFVPPHDIAAMQVLSIFSVVLCLPMTLMASCMAISKNNAFACCVTIMGGLLLIFSSTVLALWHSFSIPPYYLSKESVIIPVWNDTLKYEGRIREGRYYIDVYSYNTVELIGSPPLINVSAGPGYTLWIIGIFFVALTQVILLIASSDATSYYAATLLFHFKLYFKTGASCARSTCACIVPAKADSVTPYPTHPSPPKPEIQLSMV